MPKTEELERKWWEQEGTLPYPVEQVNFKEDTPSRPKCHLLRHERSTIYGTYYLAVCKGSASQLEILHDLMDMEESVLKEINTLEHRIDTLTDQIKEIVMTKSATAKSNRQYQELTGTRWHLKTIVLANTFNKLVAIRLQITKILGKEEEGALKRYERTYYKMVERG